jgi:hypothetical protein
MHKDIQARELSNPISTIYRHQRALLPILSVIWFEDPQSSTRW